MFVTLLGHLQPNDGYMRIPRKDTQAVARLSGSIFWLVLPSLALFLVLPGLLRSVPFWPSLSLACLATIAAYFVLVWVLDRLQVRL